MITSKYIPIVVVIVIMLCLIICGAIVYASHTIDTSKTTEYESVMFGDEVNIIDIQVDATEWQEMLDNAQAKEWIAADVIINGTSFGTVGVRTKGNSSLSMGNRMGNTETSHYSLNFKANKYVKGQTFFGLDTFCVNNMMGDATYMKDYLAYDIMHFIGVDTPLYNYAKITVNGQNYGFGIMLERYDAAYLERVYNTSAGELYSVKISMGQRADFEGMWRDVQNSMPARDEEHSNWIRPNIQASERVPGINLGNDPTDVGHARVGGGSLLYTDDNPDNYSAIFKNSVKNPDKISKQDQQRVITALKNLNEGTDLEKYINVDSALRYFAAHTVLVNNDSYTSNMAQNYYLYERQGQLTILPWDYNLSFGGMGGMGGTRDASSVVNFPIDTPVSGVSIEDRPLLNKLLEVPEYAKKYHDYLKEIVEGYFESGLYEKRIAKVDATIESYIKNNSFANDTYEQYKDSLPHLIELLRLRSESIKGQLEGTIPSTSSGQRIDDSTLIDASSVNLNALGTMGGGQNAFVPNDEEKRPEGFPSMGQGFPDVVQGNRPGRGDFDPINMPGGNNTNISSGPTAQGSRQGHVLVMIALLIIFLLGATLFIAKRPEGSVK